MRFHLRKLKNIFLRIGGFFKKHPFVVFLILVCLSFSLALYLFYQKAYLATNFSPDPQIKKVEINQSALSEIQKIINERQININEMRQKTYRNPFE